MKRYNDVHISFTISRKYLHDLEEIADGLNVSKGQAAKQLVQAYCIRRREGILKQIEYTRKLMALKKEYDEED